MAQKIYKRIGLRRDRNLSDLSNSTEALNNMLGDLAAVGGAGETFVAPDLDAIKNTYSLGLTHNDYIQVGGSAVKYYDNTTQDQRIFEPRITYQNRLDQFNVFAGEPRLSGGDGLSASYYNFDAVLENTDNIFTGAAFKVDKFWEQGNFEWTRKLHPNAVNVNGGIQWEGYFVPTTTGSHSFDVTTTGCMTLDFQSDGYVEDDGGNIISVGIETYKEYKRIGIGSTAQCSSTGTNQIVVGSSDFMKHVAIGQSVSCGSNVADGVNIDEISGTLITLSDPATGNAIVSSFTNQDVTFSKGVGTPVRGIYTTDYILERYRKYRIRFRYYVPQVFDSSLYQRSYQVEYNPPLSSQSDLRYNQLYNLDYNFTNASKGDINVFLENSILYGGNTNSTGIGSETNYLEYVKVQTSNKIDVRYDPRNITESSVVIRQLNLAEFTLNSTVISWNDTSNLEVGQYLYDRSYSGEEGDTWVFPDGTRIEQIIVNDSIIVSNPATSTGLGFFDVVEHRGHVQRIRGQSNGTSQIDLNHDYTANASTMSGRIIVGGNNVANTKIVMNGSSDSIGLSTPMTSTTGSNEIFYIYESEGIVNNSLTGFCNSATKCVMVRGSSNIPAGSVTIPVRDADSVQINDRILGYYFFDKTTVLSKIDSSNGGGTAGESSSHSITISVDGNTSTGTEKLIKPGNNFTTTSEGEGDRALCCPPKDTSPPFEATDDGMQTTSARSNLQLTTGDIKFDEFGATGITVDSPSDINSILSEESNARVRIHTPSGVFKLVTT